MMKKVVFYRTLGFWFVFSLSLVYAQEPYKLWRDLIRDKDTSWYNTIEAISIGEQVLLYQRDIGGWPKNIAMHIPVTNTQKRELITLKKDPDGCTTDNEATIQEMMFLSKLYSQIPDDRYKNAFLRGLSYLLKAQYANGGWPQFYPLKEGYYSHITYNDESMVNILRLLWRLIYNTDYYSIQLGSKMRELVIESFNKGIECILKTQYKQKGKLTGWCAQYERETMIPAKARTYELASLSGKESAGIVLLLMDIDNPSERIINAIESAVLWFEETKILGLRVTYDLDENKNVINKKVFEDSSGSVLWARFMELKDNTPFFCDRDGVKKRSITEIGEERKNGYAWYVNDPEKVLIKYQEWKNKWRKEKGVNNEFYKIVAKNGTGDYTSIMDAISDVKSFSDQRTIIFIKNGTYHEKIKVHEWNPNVTLIGENRKKTIITNSDYFDKVGLGRNSTFHTYTILVEADNFIAKNLTIKNESGEVGQAIALSSIGDKNTFVNCSFIGNQDTVYVSGRGRMYFINCSIEGTTDFIFGNATVFFEKCVIHSKKNSYITAASTSKDDSYGFVFKDCQFTGEPTLNEVYLGRPWRKYAQTVIIDCTLGKHITSAGWSNWNKKEAEKTSFYAEYNSNGLGAAPKKRVPWSYQLSRKEAQVFSLKNVLGNGNISTAEIWYEEYQKIDLNVKSTYK